MLQANAISVRRGARMVLDDITVAVRPGSLVAVVGPNGAGKSTLVAALTHLLPLEQGSVTLDGSDLHRLDRRTCARKMSVMQQRFHTTFPFKAYEIVAMGRTPFEGLEPAAAAARHVSSAMAATGTEAFAERNCHTLSGGELQRVYLARALAQLMPLPADEPRYLLLDEPTASLDLRHQSQTLSFARGVARQGVGVLAVLHDLNLAALFADEIILLEAGRIAARGRPATVLTHDVLSPVYGPALSVFTDPASGRPVVLPGDPADSAKDRP
jgi:iron complex transport system ATP-binding protein